MVPPPQKKTSALKIVLMIVIPLFVLGVIGSIVAGFLVTPIVLEQGRQAEARLVSSGVVSAIRLFETDYGVLPPLRGHSDETIPTDSNLIDVLTGSDLDLNPKGTSYLAGRKAKSANDKLPVRSGFVQEEGRKDSSSLVDPWGNFYMVIMDIDGDNEITVPGETTPLKLKAACWSYGKPPDKSDHKSALDNPPSEWVKSWE